MNELSEPLITAMLSGIVLCILLLFCATFFIDLKLVRLHNQLKTVAKQQLAKTAVIIYTKDNESGVAASLMAVYKTKLRSLEVIIIDNASSDNTPRFIKEFLNTHPKFKATTIYKRKVATKAEVVRAAQKKVQNSQVVLVINAGHVLNKNSVNDLRSSVTLFSLESPVAITSLPVVYQNYLSIAHSSLETIRYNFKKTCTVFRPTLKAAENDAWLFLATQNPLRQVPQTSNRSFLVPLYYNQRTILSSVSFMLLPLCIFGLIFSSYMLYMALFHQLTLPFLMSVAVLYSGLALSYAGTPLRSIKEKIMLFSTLPLMYPLLYIYNVLQMGKSLFLNAKTKLNISVLN